MTLPKIPDGKDWSPETWRAGLDEAVRLCGWSVVLDWNDFQQDRQKHDAEWISVTAHATTLLGAGIVEPVVSEAAELLRGVSRAYDKAAGCPYLWECPEAIAVIQSALDKARSGE